MRVGIMELGSKVKSVLLLSPGKTFHLSVHLADLVVAGHISGLTVSAVGQLTPKGPKCVFWQHSNFWQLITNGFFIYFSLNFLHNIFPGSSFMAQQFS